MDYAELNIPGLEALIDERMGVPPPPDPTREEDLLALLRNYERFVREGIIPSEEQESIDFNLVNPNTGVSNLMIVAANGSRKELKQAVNQGINPNQQDNQGNTPLIYAVAEGKRDNVDLLLEEGADPNQANNQGGTPLAYAIEKGEGEIAEMLIEAGAELETLPKFLQEEYHALVEKLNQIQIVDLAKCINKEDYSTLEELKPRGTISIQWPPDSTLCYDIRSLRGYLRSQGDGINIRTPHGAYIQVYKVTPAYYITFESHTRLLLNSAREYQAFALYDKANILGTETPIYTLLPVLND